MTSGFVGKLVIADENGLPFTLVEPLVYLSKLLDRVIVVPASFQTDLASIPRPLWAILPPVGRYDRAAVVHDYLYQTDGTHLTRGQADAVLNEAMEATGVGRFTRWTIYSAVRIGGWVPWNKYREDDHAIQRSDAEVQSGQPPQRVQDRQKGDQPQAGRRDYV